MKRLIMIALLLCPAMMCADSNIEQTWRKVNNCRVTSAVKSVAQTLLGVYALWHAADNAPKLFTDLKNIKRAFSGDQKWNHTKQIADHGVLTGGMAYAGWILLNKALGNARHALAL